LIFESAQTLHRNPAPESEPTGIAIRRKPAEPGKNGPRNSPAMPVVFLFWRLNACGLPEKATDSRGSFAGARHKSYKFWHKKTLLSGLPGVN